MRRDDAANGMTARQHETAMIQHCVHQTFGRALWLRGPVDQRATAGGAPVGFGFRRENGVAMAADAFHVFSVERDPSFYSGGCADLAGDSLGPCADRGPVANVGGRNFPQRVHGQIASEAERE